jgi:hypothetical protein
MRQIFINIVSIIISVILAIFSWTCVEMAITLKPIWALSMGGAVCAWISIFWLMGPMVHRGWRQLRQMDKIEDMDQRYAQLCEDAAGFYANGAELHAELENEIRNNEYNTKRLKDELSIANDKYEILYRTLIYNVTNPANAGFDIMVQEAGRQSNLAKLVVDEHIRLNMSPENLSQIKAQDFATFLAKINIKK